jgi:hypothetical protein
MAKCVAMLPFISSSYILLWRGVGRRSKEVGKSVKFGCTGCCLNGTELENGWVGHGYSKQLESG